ncbi:MAG: histidine kinase [Rhizobiales bacterium 62-47]|nr:HAMP domain-containing protein [Hyphomicrobiales bacterium]OJY12509.1 MAG: histidine kinase [Rhizobiales bacterium 62-47]
MWQQLSLRTRLNLLFALVLVVGLAANIGRLVLEAGPRIQAEDDSVLRLAREFVDASISDLKGSADPEAKLTTIVDGLQKLRHVSVTHERAGERIVAAPGDAALGKGRFDAPPEWFVSLVRPEQTSVRIPIAVEGKSYGSLLIASHPSDEIAEIWDGIVTQLEVGSAIAAALLLITMIVVSRALAPIQSLADAMTGIEAGHYDTRVTPTGSAEIAAICAKLNHLAGTLGEAVAEKQRLAERIVTLQDDERSEIARELHDEFGPYLFALRAHATSLMRLADGAKPDLEGIRKHGSAMLEQVNALQQFNRRVLDKLRPAGLSELGLREALAALVRFWRDAHPGVVVEMQVSDALGAIGETAELTIYRVVQEALTNAFRHSGATQVAIAIEAIPGSTRLAPAARVSVSDNGDGLPSEHKLGLGMIGMRERVMALGGTMHVASTSAGVTVEAIIPHSLNL